MSRPPASNREKEKKGCGQRGRRPEHAGSPLSIFERTREPLSTLPRVKEAAFETWPPLSVVHRRLRIVLPSASSPPCLLHSSIGLDISPRKGEIFHRYRGERCLFFFNLWIEFRGVSSFSKNSIIPDYRPSFEKNRALSIKNPPSNCYPSNPGQPSLDRVP